MNGAQLRTWLLAAEVGVWSLGVALPLAWFCLRTDAPLRRATWWLVTLLLFVPIYVQAAAWHAGFGALGWYSVSRDAVSAPWLSGWRAAVWVHSVAATPWAALILAVGLAAGWREVDEAAGLETSGWRIARYIIGPRVRPWLLVAWCWVALTTAGELTVVDLYQVDTVARELFTGFALGNTFAAAWWQMAGPLAGLMLLAVVVLTAASRYAVPGARLDGQMRFRLGPWRPWCGLLLVVWITTMVALPLGSLLYQAGLVTAAAQAPHWSGGRFLHVMGQGAYEFRAELAWTLLVGGLASTLSLCAALPAGWWAQRSRAGRVVVLLLVAALLAIPGPLLGLSLIALFHRPELPWLYRLYDESILAPVVAAACRIWPLTVALVWSALRELDHDVWDIARVEGAGLWQRVWRIALPQCQAASAVAWLLGFAVAGGELAATLLVLPPGLDTVATRVANLMHTGVREKEAALCLWHLVICATLAGIAARWSSRTI